MNKMINIIPILGALLLFACEDNKEEDNSVSFEEVTTTNVNDGPFYYNFVEKKQNETSYHLVYKNVDAGGGFSMPSFSISNTVMLSIISGTDFESVQVPPASSQFQPAAQLGAATPSQPYLLPLLKCPIQVLPPQHLHERP